MCLVRQLRSPVARTFRQEYLLQQLVYLDRLLCIALSGVVIVCYSFETDSLKPWQQKCPIDL